MKRRSHRSCMISLVSVSTTVKSQSRNRHLRITSLRRHVNINVHRVQAVLLRHMFSWPRSLERLADSFWWPTINLFTWGIVTAFLQGQAESTQLIGSIFLGGVVMWLLVSTSQQEMGLVFLQEAWDRNLLNMFTSPLTIWEFNLASVIIGIIKLTISLIWMLILARVFFAFNLFTYGWMFVPYAFSLLITGWTIGLLINGLIIQYGYRVQAFAWTLTIIFQPFSGVFYPVSAMPPWMASVARLLPSSYIFEGMRQVMREGTSDYNGLLLSYGWNILYFALAMWFYSYSFRKAKASGMIMKFS